jgi:hypothetical protein
MHANHRGKDANETRSKKESQPRTNADRTRPNETSKRATGCAVTAAITLGTGFPEEVYKNALARELTKAGLMVGQQLAIEVKYDDVPAGAYVAGPLVENAAYLGRPTRIRPNPKAFVHRDSFRLKPR